MTFVLFLLQLMTVNGKDVTPPMGVVARIPSCMVCFEYRVHDKETDLDARKRMLEAWVSRDELLFPAKRKHFITLAYHDLKGACDVSDKSVTYKRKEDFPLVDVPVPGCRNVWFVKWQRFS